MRVLKSSFYINPTRSHQLREECFTIIKGEGVKKSFIADNSSIAKSEFSQFLKGRDFSDRVLDRLEGFLETKYRN